MVAAGQPAAAIQAKLREGFNDADISVELAIQSLALGQDELLALQVKLFAEAVKLVGAQVDVDGMVQAYLDSFHLAADAFFYDAVNGLIEADVVEGEVAEIPGQIGLEEAFEALEEE